MRRPLLTSCHILAVVAITAAAWRMGAAQAPPPQLSIPCTITEVYDGDTVTVSVTLPLRVRMLDCWAPELSDPGGAESRDHLKAAASGKAAILQIPLAKADRLDDVLTFGRVLGYLWVDDINLSTLQVGKQHATRSRPR